MLTHFHWFLPVFIIFSSPFDGNGCRGTVTTVGLSFCQKKCWFVHLKKKNASKFERKSHSFTFRFRSSAIPFKNPRFGNGQSAAAAASHRGLTVLNRPVFGMFSGVPSGNLT
jgi:hypothetical protein